MKKYKKQNINKKRKRFIRPKQKKIKMEYKKIKKKNINENFKIN